jgi:pimeloyl-ACP methyl ester carboxylesterase
MLHGICNNKNLFAIPDGLGQHLSQHFDIYPYDFPTFKNREKPWDFDFHLEHDIPQIWQSVCNEAGSEPFVFGYSMGGMLAMAAQATGKINAPAIISAASPFNFGMIPLYPPLMRTAVKLSSLTGYKTIPVRVIGRMLASAFYLSSKKRQDDLNLFRYLVKIASVNVPVETILQALMWTKKRKFTDRTGNKDYLELFDRIKTPVCMIYGTNDRIAPKPTIEVGFDRVGSGRKLMISISDGTHLNMTCGNKAEEISSIASAWCISKSD